MGTVLVRPPGHRRDIALRPAAVAMAWLGLGHPHETIAVPGVALGDGDVLVAVEMSTICPADLLAVQGASPAPVPLVLGHESVGRVIATGDAGAVAVDGMPVKVGDRVVWAGAIPCGTCERCAAGLGPACRSAREYGRERIGGHGDLTGAFASHVQLWARTAIVRVPEALPASVLAPAACATATAWAALSRAGRELDGVGVRIHGAGLLGLSAAAIASDLGAIVEVLDPDDARRALALRFGAVPRLDREPAVVIETSGHAVPEAIEGAAAGGTVVLAAVPSSPEPVAFDAAGVVTGHVTVTGVRRGAPADLAAAVAFLAGRGRAYPFADAVGGVRPLSAIDEAMAAASAADSPPRIGLVPG